MGRGERVIKMRRGGESDKDGEEKERMINMGKRRRG